MPDTGAAAATARSVNVDDPLVAAAAERSGGAHQLGFTLGPPGGGRLGVRDGWLTTPAGEPIIAADRIRPAGSHNVANALAAAALASTYGVPASAIGHGLAGYVPEPHRNQYVATVEGVDYVNDSKATNPHAAYASLSAYPKIVWVAGIQALRCHGHGSLWLALGVSFPPPPPVICNVEQNLELAKQRASAVATDLKNAKDFAAAVKRAGLEIKTTELVARGAAYADLGMSEAVDAAAFSLPQGGVSDAITTPTATAVIRVAERVNVTDAEIEQGKDQTRDELVNQQRDRFFTAYMAKAKTNLKIEVKQDLLTQLMGPMPAPPSFPAPVSAPPAVPGTP